MKCFAPAVPLLLIPMLYGCTSPAATADWQWGAVMPEARSARATCAVENRIFTIGDTSWPKIDGHKVKRWHRSVYAHRQAEWRGGDDRVGYL